MMDQGMRVCPKCGGGGLLGPYRPGGKRFVCDACGGIGQVKRRVEPDMSAEQAAIDRKAREMFAGLTADNQAHMRECDGVFLCELALTAMRVAKCPFKPSEMGERMADLIVLVNDAIAVGLLPEEG